MLAEQQHVNARDTLDALASSDAMSLMIDSHAMAVEAVRPAARAIEGAALLLAAAVQAGATVYYAAAGSSGLMALADACELPGTFGVPECQIKICMAGGVPADGHMPGNTEDDGQAAAQAASAVCPGDVAIVASASGTTPYALSFAETAKARGASVISIANVPTSPLLEMADVAIALNTGVEVVEGSTRLGAGTAQKVALNMISTRAGVLMGHVHDGLMVNLNPENKKLRKRAAHIVSRIAHVSVQDATRALEAAEYNTKCATLIASGVHKDTAEGLLAQHCGRLRACLEAVSGQKKAND